MQLYLILLAFILYLYEPSFLLYVDVLSTIIALLITNIAAYIFKFKLQLDTIHDDDHISYYDHKFTYCFDGWFFFFLANILQYYRFEFK